MASEVELSYNPYIPQLCILIDGVPPSEFSSLIQFFDEDIWCWATNIMDVLYSEVRDSFYIKFTGTPQDSRIMEFVCSKCKYCIGYQPTSFPMSSPLQNRMGQLNQLIKNADIKTFKTSVIDAGFYISADFRDCTEDIQSINIQNLFCKVRVRIINQNNTYVDTDDSVLFILAETCNSGNQIVSKLSLSKPAFLIVPGEDQEILSIQENAWIMQTPKTSLLETIFNCFLSVPLLTAFRNCAHSISGGNKIKKDIKRICAVEPEIDIAVAKEVEVGRSTRISISTDPSSSVIPKLVFKIQNQKVATCDGLSVYGICEGTCILEVYRIGSQFPFFSQSIKVFKRNRITKIILSDDNLVLGVSDQKKITLSYFPADADNITSITWKSSNPDIVSVDSNGHLQAIRCGCCRIICTAGNVSAQCICTVKPYLKDIKFLFDLIDGVLYMKPMQDYPLAFELDPIDCIDGLITITSSNMDIVNIVNNTLSAKKTGEATITIQNSSGRISRSFLVRVTKKNNMRRIGFFKSLFTHEKD